VARSRLPVAFSTVASRGVAGSGEVDGREGYGEVVLFFSGSDGATESLLFALSCWSSWKKEKRDKETRG
jgi:hypothetical protein